MCKIDVEDTLLNNLCRNEKSFMTFKRVIYLEKINYFVSYKVARKNSSQ